jgi:5'-nucleotidase
MVISGINSGANVGVNINYSGTVAAAKEAALYGILAMAVSIQGYDGLHYEEAASFTFSLANTMMDKGLPFGTFLNVNFPNLPLSRIAGIRFSRQGIDFYPESIIKRVDPRNRPYYWHVSHSDDVSEDVNGDSKALSDNYITITPIKCDMTDYHTLDRMKLWEMDYPWEKEFL